MAKKFKFNYKYKPNDFWSVFKWTQAILWSLVLVTILFFVAVNYGMVGAMPDLESIQNPDNSASTTIFSADDEVLGSYYTQNRIEI